MGVAELFVGGLILTAIAGNAALKKLIPNPPKKRHGIIREISYTKETIREPMPSSKGKTVMCPHCNKLLS